MIFDHIIDLRINRWVTVVHKKHLKPQR
jgi:hypothetical protein